MLTWSLLMSFDLSLFVLFFPAVNKAGCIDLLWPLLDTLHPFSSILEFCPIGTFTLTMTRSKLFVAKNNRLTSDTFAQLWWNMCSPNQPVLFCFRGRKQLKKFYFLHKDVNKFSATVWLEIWQNLRFIFLFIWLEMFITFLKKVRSFLMWSHTILTLL